MNSRIVEFLICPRCLPSEAGLMLEAHESNGSEVINGTLRCPQCRTESPIAEGIAALLPEPPDHARPAGMPYEAPTMVSSYLWSHYADLAGDEEATGAYTQWAALLGAGGGIGLDAGCAVGRFTFELARKCDLVIGFDYSRPFIAAARRLLGERRLDFRVKQEGHLFEQCTIHLPEAWQVGNIEFIMADAQAIPVRSHLSARSASLNLLDKLPKPLYHLQELSRTARKQDAQLLISDPFSWSTEWANERDWLGGTHCGRFAGNGQDNLRTLLEGRTGELTPPWRVDEQGSTWWKIRNHRNHFELIRSCYTRASR